MNLVTALLSSLGLVAAIYLTYILGELSWKLGSVTKIPPYYRLFYITALLLAVALVSRLIKASLITASPEKVPAIFTSEIFYLWTYHIPLAVGLTVGLGVTLRYWKWLLKEK